MSSFAGELRQLLVFEQRGEEYALPLRRVREIVEYAPLTRLPATPPHVLGVLDLRGSVAPVIDVTAKLGLGEVQVGARSCIVLVDTRVGGCEGQVGILVDSVRGVIDLASEEQAAIEAVIEAGAGKSWYEIERPAGPVWLLDLDAALSEGEVAAPTPGPTGGASGDAPGEGR